MAKKYQHYQIIVEYANGEKEDIEMLKSSDIDKSNWKQMMKVYNEIKEQYKDKNVCISFCGSSNDGTLDIMFTKEFKETKDNVDIIEETNEDNIPNIEKEETTESLIESLNGIVLNLLEREKHLNSTYGLMDKKINICLHTIENSNLVEFSDEDKIKVFDSIKEAQLKRRVVKEEISIMDTLKSKISFANIQKAVNSAEKTINKIENKTNNFETSIKNGEIPKSQQIEEFKYKNFTERMEIMKSLEKTHDRVTYDNGKMMVYAYKKCTGILHKN